MISDSALVIFSGGQDSATLLFWALKNFGTVRALTFDYGQRHRTELACAQYLAASEGVFHQTADLTSLFALNPGNALTDATLKIEQSEGELPNTFVPGRNLLFLNVAMQLAYSANIRDLIIGVSQADYSGYPDCREGFIRSAEQTLRLATEVSYTIHTPLLFKSKAETWQLAAEMGADVLKKIIEHSHTCYEGNRTLRHAWGYGCGECPACVLRKKGYEEAFR